MRINRNRTGRGGGLAVPARRKSKLQVLRIFWAMVQREVQIARSNDSGHNVSNF
jgi:hypothetical protein